MTFILSADLKQSLLDGTAKTLPHDNCLFKDESGVYLRWDELKICRGAGLWILLEFFWRGEFVYRQEFFPDDPQTNVLTIRGAKGVMKLELGDA